MPKTLSETFDHHCHVESNDDEEKEIVDSKDFIAMCLAVLMNLLPVFVTFGILVLMVLALSTIHS